MLVPCTIAVLTLEDVRHNAEVLGRSYIHDAELLKFTHEYDIQLSDTHTQTARYILLEKLVDENLTDTKVFVNTVRTIMQNCESLGELFVLRSVIRFYKEMTQLINLHIQDFLSPKQEINAS